MTEYCFKIDLARTTLSIGAILSTVLAAWCQRPETTTKNNGPRSVLVFAARQIPKGAVLRREDLCESVVNSRGLNKPDIAHRVEILGRCPKYALREGQVIFEHDLVPQKRRNRDNSAYKGEIVKFVQAKHAISAGAVIKTADVVCGSITAFDTSNWLPDTGLIAGLRAKSSIAAGQVITKDILIEPKSQCKTKLEGAH
ncbi:MAG: hypothetical protein B7Z82_08360 [Halothiobacillus sp. 20-54-6]|nr:MAG: hypothetical protein B7Z82_08360 [Halothiobacillus sp. 20-54-6]